EEAATLQQDFVRSIRQSGEDRSSFGSRHELRALVLRDGFRLPETPEVPVPRLSDRRAERRYRERVIAEHAAISILGRSKPLDLESIYIALRVGKYVPPELLPDPSSPRPSGGSPEASGVIDAVEAVRRKPHRLVVLGDPGSGKTTLLKYLALRIARRATAFGDWAREIINSGPALAADAMQRRMVRLGEQSQLIGFLVGVLALLLWIAGGLLSSPKWTVSWTLGLFGSWVVLGIALLLILVRYSGAVRGSAIVGIAVLAVSAHFALVPWYAGAPMGIAFLVLLYPYWIVPPVSWLRHLRDRLTRFPLPLYLTLNDVGRSGEPLEVHLARTLSEAGFADAEGFLQRKLYEGRCLVLLDALDEVMEESAYDHVEKEISAFARRYEHVPVVVTCRSAGFRDPRDSLPGFLRVEVQEFAEKEVERFIRSWFDEPSSAPADRVEGLRQSLGRNARMRQLATNPLLLSLMCLNYELDLRLPDRRVELYQRCAEELLGKLAREAEFPPREKRRALQAIARTFHAKGVRVFDEEPLLDVIGQALKDLGRQDDCRNRFLQELMARSGLIRRQSRSSYGLAHLTWQEFFTAEDYHERRQTADLFAHVGDPWWREVVLLAAGLQRDATEVVRRLLQHDLLLGAAALADVNDPGTPAFHALRDEILAGLKTLVENESDRRQDAADAMAALGRWGGTEYLVERAQTEGHPEASLAAVLALNQAGDRGALARLCEPLGPVLKLLTGFLGKVNGSVDARILSLLDRLGFPLVHVPKGEFEMGDDAGAGDERPQHRLALEAFWIGKYPVTQALYRRFREETGSPAAGSLKTGRDDHPVVNVSWQDAVALCQWAGVQLPSEAEWEKAARGTDGRRYPWGNQWESGRCNVGTAGTSPVGNYPGDKSPYGCFDMAGNVSEWTRSLYRSYPYVAADGRESVRETALRVVRGAAFNDYERLARCASRFRDNPVSRIDGFGFRVVVSPSSSPNSGL
ncbi:MAG: SUMF1/EgtB/PvdO family nonheme iron enzyme, partial [Candidatus Eisenbacteria bacterium]|nr:SUMF1/EgtB/PvdO family nonheme iron enzyme [Candidatus Eisenbacteria bacterium]